MERKNKNSLIYEPKSRYRSHHDNFLDEDQEKEQNIEDEELSQDENSEDVLPESDSNPISGISEVIGDQATSVAKNMLKSYIMKNPMVLLALGGIFLILIVIIGSAAGGAEVPELLDGYDFDDDSFYGYVEEGYFDLNYFQINEGMWWPVGGNQLIEIDGVTLAPGLPTHTNITSGFGYRDIPGISGFHGAIDIGGAGDRKSVV